MSVERAIVVASVWFLAAPLMLSKATAVEPLDLLRKAVRQSADEIKSFAGEASFKLTTKQETDEFPTVPVSGTATVLFKGGKYHIALEYDRKLMNVSSKRNGIQETRSVDWKDDRVVIIFDGERVYEVTFSERSHPIPCRVNIQSNLRDTLRMNSFAMASPASASEDILELEIIIANLGKNAIDVSSKGNGLYEGRYTFLRSDTVSSGLFGSVPLA